MVDYRKFDKIGDDEFDSDHEEPKPSILQTSQPPPQKMTKKGKENRLRYEYQGELIYEWEQSLEEVRDNYFEYFDLVVRSL
jgi:hypothetical protein